MYEFLVFSSKHNLELELEPSAFQAGAETGRVNGCFGVHISVFGTSPAQATAGKGKW